jgi:hypothetical protein
MLVTRADMGKSLLPGRRSAAASFPETDRVAREILFHCRSSCCIDKMTSWIVQSASSLLEPENDVASPPRSLSSLSP